MARAVDRRRRGLADGDRGPAAIIVVSPAGKRVSCCRIYSDSPGAVPMPMSRSATKKVPRSTLRGQLVGKILTSIFSGEMHGGDRLIEEELAEKLGVSRTPIREALG